MECSTRGQFSARMKSFAHFFLFGFVAASFLALAGALLGGIVFGNLRHIALIIAILCAQIGWFAVKFVCRSRREKSKSPTTADAAMAPGTPVYWSISGSIAGGVCSAALFFMALPYILEIPRGAGQFDRARMEGLVAQVRSEKFRGEKQFYWTTLSGTASLSNEPLAGAPNLWAERTQDQNLKVIIWTNGGAHASFACGFAYSDAALAPNGIPADSPVFFTSGPNQVISHPAAPAFGVQGLRMVRQIDAHWWEVYADSRD
jgi:hypothetical protein